MERTRIQNLQAQIVLDHIGDRGGIVILGCDCNTHETSSTYRILDEDLDNSSRLAGLVFPFGGLPGARQDVYLSHIDYVWYNGGLAPHRVFKILDSGGSDHLPVLAVLDLQ
jgi:endonuclease/exonuclease/phosphatase (EEP) superfamily protein YafD